MLVKRTTAGSGADSNPKSKDLTPMNRTTDQLLTWAPLGAGLALILSGHRRLGLATTLVSPIAVAIEHPRGTRHALRAIPRAFKTAGEQIGCSMAKTGKGFRWLAS